MKLTKVFTLTEGNEDNYFNQSVKIKRGGGDLGENANGGHLARQRMGLSMEQFRYGAYKRDCPVAGDA